MEKLIACVKCGGLIEVVGDGHSEQEISKIVSCPSCGAMAEVRWPENGNPFARAAEEIYATPPVLPRKGSAKR